MGQFCSDRSRYLFTSPSTDSCCMDALGSSPSQHVMLLSNWAEWIERDTCTMQPFENVHTTKYGKNYAVIKVWYSATSTIDYTNLSMSIVTASGFKQCDLLTLHVATTACTCAHHWVLMWSSCDMLMTLTQNSSNIWPYIFDHVHLSVGAMMHVMHVIMCSPIG